jgi:hypothetical protein
MSGVGMTLLMLLAGHALCDYPLQGDFLAQGKNRHTKLGAMEGGTMWLHLLTAHALIHGGMVALVTGRADLGVAEAAIHWATDWAKCEGRIGYHTDQAIHVACKLVWAAIVGGVL